ncbi:hypothetical protein QBC38DRAFT_481771 [Podospora fimiseda]|uniref:Uncharacterized protein n=1 Tax=Podospora fimiseda TaxID=252190 RepID=A0AAN7BMA0_9PEZI|nr:hypothetical protein QBC38DRAFT_481771 [Podospora fimiseda]
MEIFHRENEATYYIAKNQFETRADKLYGGGRSGPQPLYDHLRNEAFMSLEEFTKYAERTSSHLKSAFDKLKKEADDEVEIEPRGDVAAALVGSGFVGWDGLSSDEKWVVQLYHKEVVKKFGGLVIVDEGLLPTGLIAMLRESRFKWQG